MNSVFSPFRWHPKVSPQFLVLETQGKTNTWPKAEVEIFMHSHDSRSWSFKGGGRQKKKTKTKTTQQKAYDTRIMIWLAAEVKPHDLCDKPQLKNLEKEGETFQHHFGCQHNRNNRAKFQHKKKKLMRFVPLSWTQRQTDVDKKMLQTVLAVVQPSSTCSDANASLVHYVIPFALAFHSLTQSSQCLCTLCVLSCLLPTQWV